jgi:hypothetical protein
MVRVCRKCRTKNDDRAHFCIKCGRVLNEEYSTELQPTIPVTAEPAKEKADVKGRPETRVRPTTQFKHQEWDKAVVLPLAMMLIVAFIFAAYGYFCNTIIYVCLGATSGALGYLYSRDRWSPQAAVAIGLILMVLLIGATRLW